MPNTYTKRLEIRAHREPWFMDIISLRVAQVTIADGMKTVATAEPLVLKTRTQQELVTEIAPTMQLRPDEAQVLMDELWRVGIRPTEGAGSAGQMAATEKHLDDMRRLVWKAFKVTDPK